MNFPSINVKATNVDLTPELRVLLDQKLEPLGKFLPEDETSMRCEVELEKTTEQQSGKIYRAEINLTVGGKLFRSEATEEQMEQAIDVMRDQVKREIRRSNAKHQSLVKRGSQRIKDMLRFGGD